MNPRLNPSPRGVADGIVELIQEPGMPWILAVVVALIGAVAVWLLIATSNRIAERDSIDVPDDPALDAALVEAGLDTDKTPYWRFEPRAAEIARAESVIGSNRHEAPGNLVGAVVCAAVLALFAVLMAATNVDALQHMEAAAESAQAVPSDESPTAEDAAWALERYGVVAGVEQMRPEWSNGLLFGMSNGAELECAVPDAEECWTGIVRTDQVEPDGSAVYAEVQLVVVSGAKVLITHGDAAPTELPRKNAEDAS